MNSAERRSAIKELRKMGFWPERSSRHGELWTNGDKRVLLARVTHGDDPRAVKNLRSLLGRISRPEF